MATFHPVFLLLLAWSQAVPAHVEPPTNVTLHCHNLLNVLKWSYGEFLPGLKFKVFVGSLSSPPQVIWVDPPNLQADVSFSSDPRNDYFINVKAVIGQDESAAAPPGGIKFSFFKGSLANQKCFLDFPAVNVSVQDDHVMFSFTHPWLLYNYTFTNGRVKRRDSEPIPEFKYSVAIVGQGDQRFFCYESLCEDKVILMDQSQKKYCLDVNGEMDKMEVKATQPYCAEPIGFAFIFIGVALLALLLLGFIFFMVYKKKTKPSSSTPDSMTFYGRVWQLVLPVPHEQMIVPDVEPASPTPLLPPPDKNEKEEITPAATVLAEPQPQLWIEKNEVGGSNTDEGVCEDIEGGNREESLYMPGKNMEDDVTESSDAADHGYEKRPVVVDMGEGENAEGYRG
ncbi:growth/differentiation factor 10b isoform 2-T2 [Acanthopagrus schlegelii]